MTPNQRMHRRLNLSCKIRTQKMDAGLTRHVASNETIKLLIAAKDDHALGQLEAAWV